MVDTIEKLNLNKLDKSEWKTYRFDQIAKSISERVDPTNTDLDIYVGLEHLDSDSVHITRFGKREDVTGTKLRCYPGDVIFGRRRAYQRKAAIVEFDGFCSAHSLVLRANPKVIDPKLFPFFLHSDTFMNRAIDISVGSLSPTINWGTLKTQEFLLPPIEQQAELAELLWAGDEVVERYKTLLNSTTYSKEKYFITILSKISDDQTIKLSEVLSFMGNGTTQPQNLNSQGLKVTRIETISHGVIDENKVGFVLPNKSIEKFKLNVGDILFSHINSISHIGKVAFYENDINLYHGMNLMRLKVDDDKALSKFLFYYLRAPSSKKYYEKRAKPAVNQASLDQDDIGSLKILLPTLNDQITIVKKMELFDKTIEGFVNVIKNFGQLQRSLVNQIF
jgi:type I restriction enzyme S subunit